MSSNARYYPEWKAPSEDGQVVVWPEPAELIEQTRANQRQLFSAHGCRLQGVPLPQIRRKMRQYVGHDDSRPLVASGHQTELYHPGVWVKNVLINQLANKLDGQPFLIAVDTDAPKHLQVRWPGASIPISDDRDIAQAAWVGLLSPPTPSHLDHIGSELAGAKLSYEPMLANVLTSLRRLAMESLDLPAALVNALHEFDWSLGLRHHALLASPIWASEPFLSFVHALMSNAEATARNYNAALATYRQQHGIASQMRPMPDLFIGDEAIEMPFWLDDLHGGTRLRPSVFRRDNGWLMELPSGDEFLFDPSLDGWEAANRLKHMLAITRHRIAPRALMLTTFLRMFMVDQFVHGIGGGRYDQVTDLFIESQFKIAPPHFSVTTATMYCPEGLGRMRVCVPCVKSEGHDLRHGLLGDRKRELVGQIAALPRGSTERSVAFFQMHNELQAAADASATLRQWEKKLLDTEEAEKIESALFDRELFYAMQSRERLVDMIDRYRRLFAE